MALKRMPTELVRELNGFSFAMRIAGGAQVVRVFVADDALEDDEQDVATMRAQFDAQRNSLEAVAREKYNHGRMSADGVVVICLADILGFFE